ncbi:MAG: hypothetical protein DRG35_06380 [Deltaproteobacteria bacterium]|nr:MAG: hypothetical protein DRG35_06380 [Deltaproteobacteria bacterium]
MCCQSRPTKILPGLSQRLHPKDPGIWPEAVHLPRQPVHPVGPKAVYKFTKHQRYILTQIENIPQKHIIYIRKEIDYQKRNLLLRYI